jgi:hypothetical protein
VNPSDLTREQRMLGAAGACALYLISLFFPWVGVAGMSVDGTDVVPSWWVLLLFALVAAVVLAAEALAFDLPVRADPVAVPAYLTSVVFIVTLMITLEVDGRRFGMWLALFFSAAAAALAVDLWRRRA